MKFETVWKTEAPPLSNNQTPAIWSIAQHPTAGKFIAAAGERLLLCSSSSGTVHQSLRGHSGKVYCVAYAHDGTRFASGGSDNFVIVWNNKGEGILKYKHDCSVQCLDFNPVTKQLASGTEKDYGLWSPEDQKLEKFQINSRCLCLSWTNDGKLLALGLYNGNVLITDNTGKVLNTIKTQSDNAIKSPAWCLAWGPLTGHTTVLQEVQEKKQPRKSFRFGKKTPATSTPVTVKSESSDSQLLVVGSWSQKLQFYNVDGSIAGM